MNNYIREIMNDIEAGADTCYLMGVNNSMLEAGAIDAETWQCINDLILKSKLERVV